MLLLTMREAEVGAEALAGFPEFVSALSKEYRPLLGPSLSQQAKILGLKEEALPPLYSLQSLPVLDIGPPAPRRCAEVFAAGRHLLVLALESKEERFRRVMRRQVDTAEDRGVPEELSLVIYCIGPDLNSSPLDVFANLVEAKFGVSLRPRLYTSGEFDDLKSEGMESPDPPTDDELDAAILLSDKTARVLAIAIKSSGGLLLSAVPKQLPADDRDRSEWAQEALRSQGVVETELVVICRQTQDQVARVPSPAALEAASRKGVKCACGRGLGEERTEEAITITQFGRDLLDGSRWFSILLLNHLSELGLPLERVLIEQREGGDEMDCFADIGGELTLFELKDKEFSLGNAYSFGAKIGIYQPQHPVIVTTEQVANDAKEHFKRAGLIGGRRVSTRMRRWDEEEVSIRYIEGIEALGDALSELVSEIHSRDATNILSGILPRASLEGASLLKALEAQSTETKQAPRKVPMKKASRKSPSRQPTGKTSSKRGSS